MNIYTNTEFDIKNICGVFILHTMSKRKIRAFKLHKYMNEYWRLIILYQYDFPEHFLFQVFSRRHTSATIIAALDLLAYQELI